MNTLNEKLGHILRSSYDVVCLSETRQTSTDVQFLLRTTKAAGWAAHAVPAMTTCKGGRSGGVVILSRQHIRPIDLSSYPKLRCASEQGRLAMGVTSIRNVDRPVIVAAIYGFAGEDDMKACTLDCLYAVAAFVKEHATYHGIIAGDLNLDPSEGYASPMFAQGEWFDVLNHHAAGFEPQPTCFPTGAAPSRLDHIWATRSLLGLTTGGGVVQEMLSYPHYPVTCEFRTGAPTGPCTAIPPPFQGQLDKDKVQQWLAEQSARWDTLIQRCYDCQDMEQAACTLSRKWESFWRFCSNQVVQGGRGTLAEGLTNGAHRRRQKTALQSDTARLLVGRLRAIRNASAAGNAGVVALLEGKIRATLRDPPFLDHASELSEDVCLDQRLCCALGIAEKLVRLDRKTRAECWRAALEAPDGALPAKQLKGFRQLPITMIDDENGEGSYEADPYRVAAAISRYWEAFHNPEDPDEVDYEVLDAFLQGCAGTLFALQPITHEEVAASISNLRARTSTGPDGWRAMDVKKLPGEFAVDLSGFLNHLEKASSWPTLMKRAWLAPVPKSDRRTASETRPIAIFGTWYRIWSATRSRSFRTWMETLLAPEQSAYRAQRSAEEEALRFDRYLEQRAQHRVLILTVDLTKAFDCVNHSALQHIWGHLGMTPESIQTLVKATMQQDRRLCVASRYLSQPYAASTGLAQGCAVSVCSFNCYVAPLIWALRALAGDKCVISYADDLVLASPDEELLRKMADLTVAYMRALVLRVNPSKCAYGVWGAKASTAPASFQIHDTVLYPTSSLDILGVTINCAHTPFTSKQRSRERCCEAAKRLVVLKSAKISWVSKSRAVATLISPMLCYGAWRTRHTKQELRRRRTLIVEAVHGKVGKGARAAEFLTAFFSPVHLVDPFGSLLWRLLRLWAKHLRFEEDILLQVIAAFGSNPRNKGPLACLVFFWKEMGMTYSEEHDAFFLEGRQVDLLGEAWDAQTQRRWRQRLRSYFERVLAERRPDMMNLAQVDYQALARQQKQWTGPPAALLRGIQAGGTTTPDRVARQSLGERVMCPCGTGHANFEHIMWSCPHVASCRTLVNQDDYSTPTQMCAIPIVGCPPHVQDALAKQAMQTMMAWKKLHALNGSHDDDGNHVPDDDDGESSTRVLSTPVPPREDGPPEGWRVHPKANCLWLSPDGLRIMCTKCRTQARSDGYARHIQKHEHCNYAPRVTPTGRVPKGIPQHLTWTKGDDGVRHIHCLRCCARAHFTKRSTFVKRHELCVDLSRLEHARPGTASTASTLPALPVAPNVICNS